MLSLWFSSLLFCCLLFFLRDLLSICAAIFDTFSKFKIGSHRSPTFRSPFLSSRFVRFFCSFFELLWCAVHFVETFSTNSFPTNNHHLFQYATLRIRFFSIWIGCVVELTRPYVNRYIRMKFAAVAVISKRIYPSRQRENKQTDKWLNRFKTFTDLPLFMCANRISVIRRQSNILYCPRIGLWASAKFQFKRYRF